MFSVLQRRHKLSGRLVVQRPGTDASEGADAGADPENSGVVVAVFRADQPIGDVVDRISRSL